MMQAAAATLVDAPNVAVELVIKELGVRLSAKAKVITEEGEEWGASMQRWTDIGKENPGAIVCVAEEDDVVETVRPYICYILCNPDANRRCRLSSVSPTKYASFPKLEATALGQQLGKMELSLILVLSMEWRLTVKRKP